MALPVKQRKSRMRGIMGVVVGAMAFAICSVPPMANVLYATYTNFWPPAMAAKVMGIAKGMERFEVAKAAVELGIFEILETGPKTAHSVAKGIGASERGTFVTLEYLKTMALVKSDCGFFASKPCEYSLATSTKMFLVKSAGPMNLGSFIATVLGSEEKHSRLAKVKDAIVRGGVDPRNDNQDARNNNNEYYKEFAEATWTIAYEPAKRMANFIQKFSSKKAPSHILDVACGSGAYGVLSAKKFPKVKITALDQAVVIPSTKKIVAENKVSDRFTFITGSAFDAPLPARKFDVIIIANFIHLFDPKTTADLLKRFKNSLAQDGLVILSDIIRHDKPSVTLLDDFSPIEFDFNMLATTVKGQTYSIPELDKVFQAANLTRVALKRNFPFPFTFVAAK